MWKWQGFEIINVYSLLYKIEVLNKNNSQFFIEISSDAGLFSVLRSSLFMWFPLSTPFPLSALCSAPHDLFDCRSPLRFTHAAGCAPLWRVGYDQNVQPQIAHVFQSAAMRFGHTMVPPGVLRRYARHYYCRTKPKYSNSRNRNFTGEAKNELCALYTIWNSECSCFCY